MEDTQVKTSLYQPYVFNSELTAALVAVVNEEERTDSVHQESPHLQKVKHSCSGAN